MQVRVLSRGLYKHPALCYTLSMTEQEQPLDLDKLQRIADAATSFDSADIPFVQACSNSHAKGTFDLPTVKRLIARARAQETLKDYYYEKASERDQLKARVTELEGLFVDMDGHDGGPNDLSWDCLQFAIEEKGKRLAQMSDLEAIAQQLAAWRALGLKFCGGITSEQDMGDNYPGNSSWSDRAWELYQKACALDNVQAASEKAAAKRATMHAQRDWSTHHVHEHEKGGK